MSLRLGIYTERVQVLEKLTSETASLGRTVFHVPIRKRWMALADVSGREQLSTGGIQPQRAYRAELPYDAQMTPALALEIAGALYDIQAVRHIGDRTELDLVEVRS